MTKGRLLCLRSFALGLSALALCLFTHTAGASGVSVNLLNTNTTFAEGSPIVLDFSIDNTSGSAISIEFFGMCGPVGTSCGVSGEGSDTFFGEGVDSSSSCPNTLADSSSCTFAVDLITSSTAGDMDGDSGITSADFTIFYNCPDGTPVGCTTASAGLRFTIEDPASATPEPSSLFLLGTGLFGLGPAIRRRFARANSHT